MKLFSSTVSLLALALGTLSATPTSVFWTNCTTQVQPKETFQIGLDALFSASNRRKNGSSITPDIGLTYGLLSGELGVDYLGGVSHPWLFNGKVNIEENRLFANAPSFSVGLFNIGTEYKTNQAVLNLVAGHSLPRRIGNLYAGFCHGRKVIGPQRSGWMVAYQKGFYGVEEEKGKTYDKWQLNMDYASPKNAIGGGGVGISYYFTDKISLETGPVWFRDTKQNGHWKWSVQVDIVI